MDSSTEDASRSAIPQPQLELAALDGAQPPPRDPAAHPVLWMALLISAGLHVTLLGLWEGGWPASSGLQPVLQVQLGTPVPEHAVTAPRRVLQPEIAVMRPLVRPDLRRVTRLPVAPVPLLLPVPLATQRVREAHEPAVVAVAPVTPEVWSAEAYAEQLQRWLEQRRVYPRAARRAGLQGEVRVRFRLDAAGVVSEVGIAQTSGVPMLDRAAVALVQRASPLPVPDGQRGAGAASLAVEVPVRYRLEPDA